MKTKEAVLLYLQENSGEPISGEKMALALNKSRTSIWKAIQSLKKEGYAIDSSTNKGYTLSERTYSTASSNRLGHSNNGKYDFNE